jgi:hypothetical protein
MTAGDGLAVTTRKAQIGRRCDLAHLPAAYALPEHAVTSPAEESRHGLQVPAETSRFQLVAQVIETVVPLIVSGCQM